MVLLRGGTDIVDKDPWFRKVRDRVEEDDGRTAFVFIHGYNTTFEEAALRTAQIGYDLEFPGAPILYSWPSAGSRFAYAADEEDARWSKGHLVEFLKDIRNRAGADNVTLIAHSLGGRLLSNALEILGNSSFAGGEVPFNEIVLSAPDIDADIFKTQIMPTMRKLANGRTLYASSEDWALIFARDFLRGGKPRAGDSGDQIIVMPDLETIDATDVRTDFWRHDDVSNRSVLTDMYALVREGKRAIQRQYLREQETENGIFWRLAP
jgi:esterase/lipase superfamily enzyme